MKRRDFIQTGLAAGLAAPALAALKTDGIEQASTILRRVVEEGTIRSAVLHVRQKDVSVTRAFGKATDNSMFLLGSISKPICLSAAMTLFDEGKFKLTDRLQRYFPEFKGGGREEVTIQHLLTHTSGLPDQLPENNQLRAQHATLVMFGDHAAKAKLSFAPGTQYQYSSMGVLLATRVAEMVSGVDIRKLVTDRVFGRLKMEHCAQGMRQFSHDDLVPVQIEHAAPEAGGGDPTAKLWDWNSPWWRGFGAPWGGTHASAGDIAKWLEEFLYARGVVVKPETSRLMTRNQNAAGFAPRGLGFAVGSSLGTKGISEKAFGHTGSTGTIAWADPATETICVVLTSLPAQAVHPHPRDLAADAIAG